MLKAIIAATLIAAGTITAAYQKPPVADPWNEPSHELRNGQLIEIGPGRP